VSNQVRTDRAGIVDYFAHFLPNKPRGRIVRSMVSVLDADTAIDTGTYRFTLVKDGKQQQIDARYTFVYEQRDGRWLTTPLLCRRADPPARPCRAHRMDLLGMRRGRRHVRQRCGRAGGPCPWRPVRLRRCGW